MDKRPIQQLLYTTSLYYSVIISRSMTIAKLVNLHTQCCLEAKHGYNAVVDSGEGGRAVLWICM